MIRLIVVSFFLFLCSSISFSQVDCEGEIATHCEPEGLNLSNCFKTKIKSFSKTCRKQLMERMSQEVGTTDPCAQEFRDICTDEESVTQCLQSKGNRFTTACREQFDESGSPTLLKDPFVKNIVDSCMDDMKKLCPFNAKVIGSNPTKAIRDYQNCVQSSLTKVNKKCKAIMKGKDKKKDTIQTLE